MRFKYLSQVNHIGTKLILISMTSSFIGLITFTFITLSYAINFIDEKRNLRIKSELGMLSTNLVAPVLFEDSDATSDVLKSITADPEIISAQVVSNDSLFKVSFSNNDIKTQPNSIPENKDILVFEREILDKGEKLGTLTFFVSNKEVENQIQYVLLAVFSIFILTFSLIFWISFKLQKIITKPLETLSNISKQVSSTKDYSLRVSVESNDEIGQLSHDFNIMLEQVEQRDLMLESKVQSRTSELERLAEEFRHRAFHDSLTGLPNRALLYEKFPKSISHAKRVNKKIALLLIDLDNFKTINDTMGHDFGDELLKIFAKRLTNNLRGEDLVCRLGGDEFIVLAEDLETSEDLYHIGKNLFKVIEKEIRCRHEHWRRGIP